ncbi:MAG: hypothetical protein ACYC5M_15820 [Anaerolineae bacterium]
MYRIRQEALAHSWQFKGDIHLLLTDLGMPNLGWYDAASPEQSTEVGEHD